LTQLDSAALQEELLRLSNDAMSGLSGRAEDDAASALPEPVRVMWLINWLDFEIAQGSLLAYFYNSHGRFAVQAAAALEAIGAPRMAAIVRSAQAMSGDDQRLEELTDEYWRAADADDWGPKLDRFLRRSVDQLAAG